METTFREFTRKTSESYAWTNDKNYLYSIRHQTRTVYAIGTRLGTKTKNRKAAGLDEIPPEVWKTKEFDDILLRHCNAVYNQNTIDRWTKGCILPFPNENDIGIAKNYRDITLISIVNSRADLVQTRFFSLGEASSLGEGKLWIQTC